MRVKMVPRKKAMEWTLAVFGILISLRFRVLLWEQILCFVDVDYVGGEFDILSSSRR